MKLKDETSIPTYINSYSPTGTMNDHGITLIVVMGVSGSGKTTLGAALAKALSLPFIDADDLHPEENRNKMSRGEPLTDADRAPWLVRGAESGRSRRGVAGVVVACSALKASYREVLRGGDQAEWEYGDRKGEGEGEGEGDGNENGNGNEKEKEPGTMTRTFFVHPVGPRGILLERLMARKSHFMKADMLVSQLDTLEDPTEMGEEGIIEIGLEWSLKEQVRSAAEGLRGVTTSAVC
ncbi:P-loop containing nucleoside triphosphate hydrolase protein [Multifurca ochricompacta]|uniref:gluconokinase n=1 Tax=Multifurca ochricompacta TaxID=376703 RepID=A0AAD4QM06_9AGAM|nr:P-loop containing nucleoside triphosphate hydrolase protein [Multifurca ochricompacta]